MKREEIMGTFSEIPDGNNIADGEWHILMSPLFWCVPWEKTKVGGKFCSITQKTIEDWSNISVKADEKGWLEGSYWRGNAINMQRYRFDLSWSNEMLCWTQMIWTICTGDNRYLFGGWNFNDSLWKGAKRFHVMKTGPWWWFPGYFPQVYSHFLYILSMWLKTFIWVRGSYWVRVCYRSS